MFQTKEQENHSKRPKEDGEYMPDREFKVIAIKILTGLEKRVEDFSENLNKETKYKRPNQR